MADELDAPLGQDTTTKRKRFRLPGLVPHAIAGALGLCIATFAAWALLVSDPLGGEPTISASVVPRGEMPAVVATPVPSQGPNKYDGPALTPTTAPPPNSNVVTIIDGSTGRRQEIPIAAPQGGRGGSPEQRLLEATRHGAIPKIAPDGTRPSQAYARAMRNAQAKADAPRIAIIVTGLGVGGTTTQAALTKLPAVVTLAFGPYGFEIDRTVARARERGHEVLLQVPMEPFDYPDNDPGPQTLLVSLSAEQNVDRMHWLMSRFQGYVGIANLMGARFTASDQALAPIVKEAAKRGLIYVDDGTSHRSVAPQVAGANSAAFAKSDIVIDQTPNAATIDRALARLESTAKERGFAVGTASALPVSIDRIAAWAKAAESRGVVLVPISVVAATKPGQS